ncbi:11241_t:CDS:2 [Entrophospora sp. SA101]|nr:13043_t:CDS:2 [Entrophospora sp. SA101]CAJ0868897.1 11241_t:CDS:2 [Entrophospora sp. SA101]
MGAIPCFCYLEIVIDNTSDRMLADPRMLRLIELASRRSFASNDIRSIAKDKKTEETKEFNNLVQEIKINDPTKKTYADTLNEWVDGYIEKLQEVFGKCQEAIQSGKIHEMDGSRFNGNAETGKATFQAIANSLSVSNQEDFHF